MPNKDNRSKTDMNKTEPKLSIERLTIEKECVSEDIPIFSDEETKSQSFDDSRRGGTFDIDLVDGDIDVINKKIHLLTYLRKNNYE
jgi:hypothetical protein